MRRAIPPLPQYAFMVWCLVKHRVKFNFTLSEDVNCAITNFGVRTDQKGDDDDDSKWRTFTNAENSCLPCVSNLSAREEFLTHIYHLVKNA
jgi:hypothetical protein